MNFQKQTKTTKGSRKKTEHPSDVVNYSPRQND